MTSTARKSAIAGGALAVAAGAAVLFLDERREGDAAAQSSLTVNLPPPASDRIYGSPAATGRPIVVIDPGHGGRDPGATSVSGQAHEKDLTLVFAQALRDELVKRGRVRVAMTRNDDRYLTLDERAAVARRLVPRCSFRSTSTAPPTPWRAGPASIRCPMLHRMRRPLDWRRGRMRGEDRIPGAAPSR